jgi:phage repressor protein C with HTH and peptisase S24 domain
MEPHERLKSARAGAGYPDATAAARAFGWKIPTYLSHEGGTRGIRIDAAKRYGKAFRVDPEWLLFGKGGPRAPVKLRLVESAPSIPVYDVTASAGHGAFLVDNEEVTDRLSFPPGYLRELTSTPVANLRIIRTKGDSMVPTIAEDDLVLVDMAKRDLSFDGIFVIRDDGAALLVKRIGRAARRGYVMVISDNPRYAPTERLLAEIEVIGKVIWMGVRV